MERNQRKSAVLFLAPLIAALACARQPAPERGESLATSRPAARLEFLSPRAGEIWREGSTHVIRWRADGVTRVHVEAAMGGKDRGHLAFDLDAGVDSLVWQVPIGFVTGFGPTRSDQVHLRLEDASDPSRFADSDMFTIMGAEP